LNEICSVDRARRAGSYGGAVVRLLLVLALGAAAGCYWSKYDKLCRTHVQLLTEMARKLDAVTREQDGPPVSFAEYRYPLERARDFVRIVTPRFSGRRSLAAVSAHCDTYGAVLDASERWNADAAVASRTAMDAALARLRETGAAAIAALDAER
jgi:hypothetical protein